jgi:hypothetical protein
VSSALAKLRWSIRHRGLGRTIEAATHSLGRKLRPQRPSVVHPFDGEHGTDTGGLIAGSDLASGHPSDKYIAGYAAVPPSQFRSMIWRWRASEPAYPINEYCFVDIGCGKGRALLLASEFGFREVVGVELNPALAAIALSNAAVWSAAGQSQSPIRIGQIDAIEFEWPAGPCIAFLFNPFDATLMRALAKRMAGEFRNRPSELEVLYYKPAQVDAFADDFEMIWCEATGISTEDLAVDPVADPKDETRAYRLRGRRV